ncbi:hypothetical protein HPB48_016040 [Haemaphysalis longicornis]|uniref:Endonuclease/exonuclease/phosphatase domain-containing protein n=1 Tax=Haemaphysalis longicornis TaxID=44386 RepID=A0A9J6GVW2_HAELO|nr:hypothetical protein HPB48_016040 [Haemaphysalis longicornis]
MKETTTLSGYKSHSTMEGRGVYTLVKKGIPFGEHDYKSTKISHTIVELIPTKNRKYSIFIMNIYSNPSYRQQRLKALLHRACKTTDRHRLLIAGDSNAAYMAWGYNHSYKH